MQSYVTGNRPSGTHQLLKVRPAVILAQNLESQGEACPMKVEFESLASCMEAPFMLNEEVSQHKISISVAGQIPKRVMDRGSSKSMSKFWESTKKLCSAWEAQHGRTPSVSFYTDDSSLSNHAPSRAQRLSSMVVICLIPTRIARFRKK